MEKFFIITEESLCRQEYLDYRRNQIAVNEFVKGFLPRYGVETTGYCASQDTLWIVPTKSDKEKFSAVLCKYSDEHGLVAFRKNSAIGKAWVSERKSIGLKVLREPFVPFFFQHLYGKSRNRIFEIDGTVYLYFETQGAIETPTGFREITGSEFYKTIEAHQKERGVSNG